MGRTIITKCITRWCRRKANGGLCHRCTKRKWRARHPVIAAWRALIDSARQRKKEFGLTTADFIDFVEETSYLDFKGKHKLCLQIDRRDHTRGYFKDNIRVLTCTENSRKGRFEMGKYIRSEPVDPQPDCPF